MAFVHCGSEECTKSELDLFQIAPTQTSIEKSIYIEVPPLSAVTESAPIDFFIAGNGIDYMDLNNTLLYLCCKIVKGDGTELAADAEVGLVNYPVASIFSQLDVTLGDRLVSQSNNCYPYRAFIESVLNYSDDTLATQFSAGLFYKDTAGQHEKTELDGENLGFVKRAKLTAQSRTVELLGHLHSDLFFQEKLLLNGVDVKIKLTRSKDAFCLMGSAAEGFKLRIVSASLFVKKVRVAPGVRLGHAEALLAANAKYPVDRVGMKVFSIPAGSRVPTKPLQPDFEAGRCVREYMNLVQTAGKHMKDRSLLIDREEFAQGYTLFAFDLSPDQECADHYSLIKTGNLRAEIRFGKALTVTVNMIVYGVFDNVIEINQRRNVLFDYM
ncbi:uncharacterized protein F54H12.2-like [Gopherus flavomarginatus]|uniref:uncharacterized protein F54H12.2-like n=1 Tax=Gopherus flavomarginatus TaxID=286002 RepID=UPI0021CBF1A4|nr:uncharacterized protein F54H12.2-like [Gopherus flavomarginatus]XP_050788658.1 uncharacterized protein F54H12.2-like [Gopherus flavomarginatus]XP_050789540.1 uncharacterized protein F54H12.2-like [Gopherus flavomarginatus]